jgi:hypothetical protein
MKTRKIHKPRNAQPVSFPKQTQKQKQKSQKVDPLKVF